jgi:hypothetical protein
VNRKAVQLVAVIALALATAAVAAAADPRVEKKRLRAADVALAKRTNLALTDLTAGWKRYPSKGSPSGDQPSCPGYNPDLSRFTITGEAEASFNHPQGFFIVSDMQIFPSRAQAIADFRAGATPSLAGCLSHVFERDFAQGAGGRARTTSSRKVASPRIGARAAWYRLVGRLTVGGNTAPVNMDLLAVQKGRSQVVLMFIGLRGPIRDEVALGRLLARRMR